jgi:hypothetical protein
VICRTRKIQRFVLDNPGSPQFAPSSIGMLRVSRRHPRVALPRRCGAFRSTRGRSFAHLRSHGRLPSRAREIIIDPVLRRLVECRRSTSLTNMNSTDCRQGSSPRRRFDPESSILKALFGQFSRVKHLPRALFIRRLLEGRTAFRDQAGAGLV